MSTNEEQDAYSNGELQPSIEDTMLTENNTREIDQNKMDNLFREEDSNNEVSEVKTKRKRAIWTNELFLTRETNGEFVLMFKKLQQDDEQFKLYFRMSQKKFSDLLQILTPHIRKKWTSFRSVIDPNERLAVTMKYLSGETYSNISSRFRMGISTIAKCVNETCDAITLALKPMVMPLPNEDTFRRIEEDFAKLSFPNCLGVMDGRYLTVHARSCKTGQRVHKTSSLVLLTIVDSNTKFILVDVGNYEGLYGNGVFSNSKLGTEINLHTFRTLPDKPLPFTDEKLPHVFVGNTSLPMKRNILRPYDKPSTDIELAFNDKLAEMRERFADGCFRSLCNKFPIFKDGFQNSVQKAEKLIMASCVLHNFLIDDDVPVAEESYDILGFTDLKPCPEKNTKNCATLVRDKFAEYYFMPNVQTASEIQYQMDYQFLPADSVSW